MFTLLSMMAQDLVNTPTWIVALGMCMDFTILILLIVGHVHVAS